MKTAVIFADGIKQIVFTPENEDEKTALSLFTAKDDIELVIKTGTMYNPNSPKPLNVNVGTCQGGYLRIFNDEESVMFVLKPKLSKTAFIAP